MWADFHWHARDWAESHKETVKRSLELAYASGGLAIGVMPNTTPPLTTLEFCQEYLKLADGVTVLGEKQKILVQMYVHLALTSDLEQVKRAIEATRKEPGICGMKAYWGHSTGNLGILQEEIQSKVFSTLTQEGYEGVLVNHCEDDTLLSDTLYNSQEPKTWSTHCRPEKAEIASFIKTISLAEQAGFQGKFHVAHVSTLQVVDFINNYTGKLRISCGVTPHHFLLDNSYLERPDGAWYKCNPPLRSKETQQRLLERLMQGKIPIIESDHAPHTAKDKTQAIPASGIASGLVWPELRFYLRGLGMSREQIKAVTFDNAVALYGLQDKIIYEERKDRKELETVREKYPHQPFGEFF
ncbi:hypothetical protein HYX13_00320 [Candidatus Woesearchaeota archaeon]|nr:hypothetical protein [Candidatus Woesearchaeota archaeon]